MRARKGKEKEKWEEGVRQPKKGRGRRGAAMEGCDFERKNRERESSQRAAAEMKGNRGEQPLAAGPKEVEGSPKMSLKKERKKERRAAMDGLLWKKKEKGRGAMGCNDIPEWGSVGWGGLLLFGILVFCLQVFLRV